MAFPKPLEMNQIAATKKVSYDAGGRANRSGCGPSDSDERNL